MIASDEQIRFIRSLMAEREMSDESRETAEQKLAEGLDKKTASNWITRLLELPKKEQAPADDLPKVPAGRYAVEWMGERGVKFYRVDRPTDGKWKGWTFVKVQASDEFWPVKGREERREILEAIAEDPQAASVLYGRAIGACGVCGRTLTDEESRERGIGPVCAERMGW